MSFAERFKDYFEKEVAQKAARSIKDGAEIEFRITPAGAPSPVETFTFHREGGKNAVKAGPALKPQLVFLMPPGAAEEILNQGSEDIGQIAVEISKKILSSDPEKKIGFEFKTGVIGFLTNGYFGVIATGGTVFASFLASKGLSGLEAIKAILKKKG